MLDRCDEGDKPRKDKLFRWYRVLLSSQILMITCGWPSFIDERKKRMRGSLRVTVIKLDNGETIPRSRQTDCFCYRFSLFAILNGKKKKLTNDTSWKKDTKLDGCYSLYKRLCLPTLDYSLIHIFSHSFKLIHTVYGFFLIS